MSLKTHHLDLLRALVDSPNPVPLSSLDGRTLRPLRAQELVVEHQGRVSATSTARQVLAQAQENGGVAPGRLSPAQEEMLRYLLRQTGPVLGDHLDGRVVRALTSRGLVGEERGWVTPTAEGRDYFQRHERVERGRRRRRSELGRGSGRAAAILKVVERLEAVIPRNAELMVGDLPCYADDLLAGLRRYARQLQTSSTLGRRRAEEPYS